MTQSQGELRRGQIVWAVLRDSNGFRKLRPAVVMTPTHQISPDKPLVLCCITTRFKDPPPEDHVPLPWNADPRRVQTRLAHRSAAVATWLDVIYPDEILEIKGELPRDLLDDLDGRIRRAGKIKE